MKQIIKMPCNAPRPIRLSLRKECKQEKIMQSSLTRRSSKGESAFILLTYFHDSGKPASLCAISPNANSQDLKVRYITVGKPSWLRPFRWSRKRVTVIGQLIKIFGDMCWCQILNQSLESIMLNHQTQKNSHAGVFPNDGPFDT